MRFVHPQNFFDIFQNLGADGTGLADKLRTVTDSADDIRIVTNSYGMHGSLWDGLYVSSAESVSVCVTGAHVSSEKNTRY